MLMTTTLAISDPSAYDILLGRHKHCFHHVGNQAFRALIALSMPTYRKLQSKRAKMNLVTLLLEIIHQGGGRFLREGHDSLWHGVKRRTAREKISHALRDHATRLSQPQGRSDSPSDDVHQDDVQEQVIIEPRPCWRTIVYETLEIVNEKKAEKSKSKKSAAGDDDDDAHDAPVDERHYEHLDTKNLSTSTVASSTAGTTSVARSNANLNTTRTNLLTSMPFPHYLPYSTTSSTTTPLQQPSSVNAQTNAYMNMQQNIGTGDTYAAGWNDSAEPDLFLFGDARRQNELLGGGGTSASTSAFATSNVAEAPFASGIPRYSRLVASRRHSLTSNPLRTEDMNVTSSAPLASNNNRYTQVQGMNGYPMADGNVLEQANQVAAAMNFASELHHQHAHQHSGENEHSFDPIPLESIPVAAPASNKMLTHHHQHDYDDEIIAPEPAPFVPATPQQQNDEQQAHRRSHSQVQVDSMLLDLFKR